MGGSNTAKPTILTTLVVSNMDCPSEVELIEKTLEGISGVDSVSCNILSRKVDVSHTDAISAKEISEILTSAGLELASNVESPKQSGLSTDTTVIVSGTCLSLGYLLEWFLDYPVFALLLFLCATITGGWHIVPKAKAAALRLSPDMNLLMTIAVTGAFLIGEYAEGATVTFLFAVSEYLESFSITRARNAIKELMELSPETARVITTNGEIREELVENVPPGALVSVRSGERVPLDGEVVNGRSSINQAPITGESMPVEKAQGDDVFAGSINGEGSLEIRVTKAHRDTTLSRIIHLVEEAQSEKAPTQRFVERFARIYTPIVLVLAILVAVVPPLLIGGEVSDWLYRSLVLLVIACPCALVIATPVAIVAGLTALAKRGVLVKGGSYLEELGKLKALAVDKTGTITKGTPVVTEVCALNDTDQEHLIQIATSINANSTHPLADAIRSYAENLSISPKPTSNYQSVTGKGAKADIDGCQYFVGNHRFVHEIDVCSQAVEAALEKIEMQGQSVVVVGHISHGECKGEVLGILGVSDPIRSDAKKAIELLHQAGITEIVMLSGDNQRTVDVISKQAGIDSAYGDLLPEDKVAQLRKLINTYKSVAMIGDGVNDAPALAIASVGVAMGVAGTDTAMETADIALMQDELGKLAEAVKLGAKTLQTIKVNISLALSVKALFLVLALLGWTSLWLAILADTGTTLLVIAYALRLLKTEETQAYTPAD